jgi:peptide/nickel transport system substrate-binding protein
MTNPIGPGKGDKLPYIDRVQYIVLPDSSTALAAFRTGKTAMRGNFDIIDADQMRRDCPELEEAMVGEPLLPSGAPESLDPPCDTPPFDDIRVRKALHMATDLNAINEAFFDGRGQILTWPWPKIAGYEKLYLGLDDPDCPEEVKELFTYNPEKAKELLKEAGFPTGFKTSALMVSGTVDYWAIIKDMWAKVGVELELDVRESATRQNVMNSGKYTGFGDGGAAAISAFHSSPTLTGTPSAAANTSHIFDPIIDKGMADVRMTILRDGYEAGMVQMRELMKYVLAQAYAIPTPMVIKTRFWWPWLEDYTGEDSIGYHNGPNWAQFVWIDQDLRKAMGHQ